ncbi:MAG: hypothetical protein WD768_18725 [Phycisphaeraceae bacterium]
MRNRTLQTVTAGGLVALMLFLAMNTRADQPVKSNAQPARLDPNTPPEIRTKTLSPPTQEWRNDPACQLVFFAVLEGLYTDGVPDEVVNLIVPPASKDSKDDHESVKRCFVFRCPLCHAAYEAFVLYQRRQAFHGSDEKNSTFGKNFDRKIVEGLKSDQASVRVFAMGAMIRPWIERRMNMLNMSDGEQKVLLDKLLKFAGEGNDIFNQYKGRWSVYAEWMFYGGCQACEAARTVAEKMEAAKNQAPQ